MPQSGKREHSVFDVRDLNAALLGLGARSSAELFEELRTAYCEPARYYHTDVHVAECLRHAKRYAHLAESLPEIEVAIWFHDAVCQRRLKTDPLWLEIVGVNLTPP